MKDSYQLRKDEKLLTAAKRIFGNDLVISAWKETRKRVKSFEETDGKELRYDFDSIVLEFNNKRKVIFHNSEWASMERIG